MWRSVPAGRGLSARRWGLDARIRRLATTDAALSLGSGLLAVLLACLVLEIWKATLSVPFSYSWDGNHYAMFVKGTLEHGWIYRNPDLGAPFGQQLYDWPIASADTLQVLLIKLIGVFSSDWATVMNVYFLLTFALVAASAYLVLRRLGCAPAASLVCSVLFALAPYHFVRGENHLFFSGYLAVPLGSYLALAVLADEPLFARRTDRRGLLAYASRLSLSTIALCAVVGLAAGGPYYAAFTIFLVAAGAVVAVVVRRSVRPLWSAGLVSVVIAGVLAASLAPALVYRARHGTNPVVGHRGVKESEIQALKLTQLVLPIEHHRIRTLARGSQKYADIDQSLNEPVQARLQRPREATAVHLGTVASLGFVFLVLVAVAGAATGSLRISHPRYRHAAAAAVIAFLIGTVGGISALFAGIVSSQLRSWNRISIFIAFFSFLAVALVLSTLERRWHAPGRRLALAALLAATLGIGVLDQTSAADVPNYRAIAAQFSSDGEFVRGIERRLGGRGSVFQLPYVPFPEGGITYRLTDYDLVHGYLHSSHLRWSFGAMTGRPQDWQGVLSEQPVTLQLEGAAAAGFDGLYVDRFGYRDGARSLDREIRPLVGTPLLTSRDGRLEFFDLRPLTRRLARTNSSAALAALRRATLEPLKLAWGQGFGPPRTRAGQSWRQVRQEAELVVTNPSRDERRALLEIVLARHSGATSLTVSFSGASRFRTSVPASEAAFRRVLSLEPGQNVVRVAGSQIPARTLLTVLDEGFRPFVSRVP